MAAALLTHHAKGRVDVHSAGSEPAAMVNPMAVAALAEWGIDITDQQPKMLTDDAVRTSDIVITMGCGDACPVYPDTRYLDWDLTDPTGQDVDTVRAVRDEIDTRVRGLVAELVE